MVRVIWSLQFKQIYKAAADWSNLNAAEEKKFYDHIICIYSAFQIILSVMSFLLLTVRIELAVLYLNYKRLP